MDLHDLKKEIDREVKDEAAETLLGYEDRKTGHWKKVDLTKYSEKELAIKAKLAARDALIEQLKEDNIHFEKQWKRYQKEALKNELKVAELLDRLRKYEPDAK